MIKEDGNMYMYGSRKIIVLHKQPLLFSLYLQSLPEPVDWSLTQLVEQESVDCLPYIDWSGSTADIQGTGLVSFTHDFILHFMYFKFVNHHCKALNSLIQIIIFTQSMCK